MATIPNLTLDGGLPAAVDAEKTILGAILLDMPRTPKPRRGWSRTTSRSTPTAVSF